PRRLAHSRADQVRAWHQRQDRQGAGPRRAVASAADRRRGDRIAKMFAAVHESAFGPKRTSLVALHMSAFTYAQHHSTKCHNRRCSLRAVRYRSLYARLRRTDVGKVERSCRFRSRNGYDCREGWAWYW